jgi:dethiobiotin synthetase/adenosylmethionine--8-amino-7-oxononanoate aminotransferase
MALRSPHQINKKEDVMVIDSAHGDHFDAYYSKPQPQSPSSSSPVSTDQTSLLNSYFDGSASWFTYVPISSCLDVPFD